MHSGVTLRN